MPGPCARAVRQKAGGSRAWRIAFAGYGLATLGIGAASVVLIGDSAPDGDALNLVFLLLMFSGMLLSMIGSTLLGIALFRARYAPRFTAWLLVLAFPFMLAGSDVLGHNSLGMVPLFVAWAATGWQLWRVQPSHADEPRIGATQ